jgi:hypothetical protein
MIEMAAVKSHTRLRRKYRHYTIWVFARAVLAYAFAQMYLYLYGPAPAVVPRLGMTVAALCGAGAVLFAVSALILWFADYIEHLRQQWLPRMLRDGGVR